MAKSPIEAAMRDALVNSINETCSRDDVPWELELQEQARTDRAVVDFLITCGRVRLAVECDGHDFHDRTKERASRDRARDRRLQAAGITVFRFTGSDIHWDRSVQ